MAMNMTLSLRIWIPNAVDDLMAEATDSPAVSRLFSHGRHRNNNVSLFLQKMFLKGKFNPDINQNAQFLSLL